MPSLRVRSWLARAIVLVVLVWLGMQAGTAPALTALAPHDVIAAPGPASQSGNAAFVAPLSQVSDTQADNPTDPGATAEPDRLAVLTRLLDRQGPRSMGNLERVASITVLNLTVKPEFVVDSRVQRAAAAHAAALEAAAAEATRFAETATEAQAEVRTAVAAALAADQQDDDARAAALAATHVAEASAVRATATAEAQAAASAVRAAEAATARAEAHAAAAVESNRQFLQRVTLLVLALALLTAGFLCLRLWRNRKEPFVLKAIPTGGAAHANA